MQDLDERHGTYAGYNQHIRDKERPCPGCRAAATDYQNKRRKSNPDAYAQEKFMNLIRSRALWRLAQIHHEEFQRLIDEEIELELDD